MDPRGIVKVAIVGFGYWGPNLARNFANEERSTVSHICDLSDQRLTAAAKLFPRAIVTKDIDEVLADSTVDLVAISTPVRTHARLAMRCLDARKHIFVEKPLCTAVSDGRQILAAAHRAGLHVFVDHTFAFTPAVRKMRDLVLDGSIGRPLYYDSIRVNLGLFQHDINVVWDLVTHDIAILDFLLDGRMPTSASCTGMAHFGSQHADLAYLTLNYDDEFIAHVNVNWLAPVKVRQVLLCGDRRMVVYDDNSASEKIKIYDSGVKVQRAEDVYEMLIQYRKGDMHAPRLDTGEALAYEVKNVIDTLNGSATATCGGIAGLRIVAVLEAADASLRTGGQSVFIERITAGHQLDLELVPVVPVAG